MGVGAPAPVLRANEVAMFRLTEPSREEIARRAHELYLKRGSEQGKDVEDWVRAEKELRDDPVAGTAKPRTAQAGGRRFTGDRSALRTKDLSWLGTRPTKTELN